MTLTSRQFITGLHTEKQPLTTVNLMNFSLKVILHACVWARKPGARQWKAWKYKYTERPQSKLQLSYDFEVSNEIATECFWMCLSAIRSWASLLLFRSKKQIKMAQQANKTNNGDGLWAPWMQDAIGPSALSCWRERCMDTVCILRLSCHVPLEGPLTLGTLSVLYPRICPDLFAHLRHSAPPHSLLW